MDERKVKRVDKDEQRDQPSVCPRCGGAGETLAYDVCPVCGGDGVAAGLLEAQDKEAT